MPGGTGDGVCASGDADGGADGGSDGLAVGDGGAVSQLTRTLRSPGPTRIVALRYLLESLVRVTVSVTLPPAGREPP